MKNIEKLNLKNAVALDSTEMKKVKGGETYGCYDTRINRLFQRYNSYEECMYYCPKWYPDGWACRVY